MKRIFLFSLVLCLGGVSVCFGGIRTDYFTLTREGDTAAAKYDYIGVKGGRLVPGQSRHATYDEAKPNQWFVVEGKIKSKAGSGYLAYDPSGKDNEVFLTAKPGEGTQWLIEPIRTKVREEERGSIQAAAGPMKGWRLVVEEREEKEEGGDGKTVTVRRLVLAKGPTRGFEAWRVYQHK